MSGVAEAAGVARGTVYRYFSGSDELLAELGELIRELFERGVVEAAAAGHTTREKLEHILRARVDRESRKAMQRLREMQPGFTLNFYNERFNTLVAIHRAALAPGFEPERSRLSLDALADLVTRILITETLFDNDLEHIACLIMSLWDAVSDGDRDRSPAAPAAVRPRARSGTGRVSAR